jgi:hypothetical protein
LGISTGGFYDIEVLKSVTAPNLKTLLAILSQTSSNHKQIEMKLTTLLFFSILSILASCNGQTISSQNQSIPFKEINIKGDNVKEIGSSIMVIYQDKKIIIGLGVGKRACTNMMVKP